MAPQRDPDMFFSHQKGRYLIAGVREALGHSVHSTCEVEHVAHGILRQIGFVFRSGVCQRGRWIAFRTLDASPSEPFKTRLLAGRWLMKQESRAAAAEALDRVKSKHTVEA